MELPMTLHDDPNRNPTVRRDPGRSNNTGVMWAAGAVAVLLVLGLIFWSMGDRTTDTASTPTTTTSQPTTTGSPGTANTGGTTTTPANRPANPPAANPPASNPPASR
jgi:hypothetical protein